MAVNNFTKYTGQDYYSNFEERRNPDGTEINTDGLGYYQSIPLDEIITNFIISNVGEGMYIQSVKRDIVAFHAQRAIQEFSYDTFKSITSTEVEINPDTLAFPLPQDYVQYVKLSWVDDLGQNHVIYPTNQNSNPTAFVQDDNYDYIYDETGEVIKSQQSITRERFQNPDNVRSIVNNARNYYYGYIDGYDFNYFDSSFNGRRFGVSPEDYQTNGNYFIDNNLGMVFLDSTFSGQGTLFMFEYISDGLAGDNPKVPKLAEQAVYDYINWSVCQNRQAIPVGYVDRLKRQKSASMRNAKIRLQNYNLEEISQVARNQAKWIKH